MRGAGRLSDQEDDEVFNNPAGPGQVMQLSPSERPVGAVYLTESQVVNAQNKLVQEWKPVSEIWPFKFGPMVLAASAGITGFVALRHMRNSLGIRSAGKWSIFVAAVPLPSVMVPILYSVVVTRPIMLNEIECPTCSFVRATSLQTLVGFVHPVTLAVLSSAYVADRHRHIVLPKFSQPLELLGAYQKMVRPMGMTLMLLLALNLASVFKVTQRQMETAPLIHRRMMEGSSYVS